MKKPLGKGLQSLIPKKESKITGLIKSQDRTSGWAKTKKESIFNVEIDKISPNPHQPRKDILKETLKELANSIREHGILQPLLVTKKEKPTERGRQVEYELVAGERRWRAAQMAGLPHVPVIIRDSTSHEKLELALVENLQREDLNPIDTALAFKQLSEDFNLTHQKIAQKVGKNRVTVTNALRLLNLPAKIQQAIAGGKIAEAHGRAILMAKPSAQIPLFQKIIKNKLAIDKAEIEARKVAPIHKPRATGPKNLLLKKMEKELEEILGCRVSISQREGASYLRIEFANQKTLDKIANYLLKI